jgi:hypothetical protein
VGTRDLGRIETCTVGKCDQETFIAKHMLKHAGEKAGLARRRADLLGWYSGHVKEAPEPLRLLGDEGKSLNRQHFRRLPGFDCKPLHALPFAFP